MWPRAAAALVLAVVATVGPLGLGPAAAAPELTVTPASGPPGTEIVVTGTGFAALPVEIRWGGLSGPVIGTGTGPAFSVAAVVPDSLPNSVPVMAVITDGNSVSTSSASFQVTAGAPAPEETTTTTSTTVAQPPPASPTASIPGGEGARPTGRGGLAGGVDGGVDPDMAGTTGSAGGGTGGGGGAAAQAGETATSTVPPGAAAGAEAASPAVTPAPGGEPGAPVSAGDQGSTTVPAPPGDGVTAAALAPSRTSQSAGAVSNPALLVVGLALVFGGGVFLAVRNRQRA